MPAIAPRGVYFVLVTAAFENEGCCWDVVGDVFTEPGCAIEWVSDLTTCLISGLKYVTKCLNLDTFGVHKFAKISQVGNLIKQIQCRQKHALGLASAASAAVHPSTRVMLAALKFFLGQDEREDEDSDDDEEPAPAAPSREDMYRAKHKVGKP